MFLALVLFLMASHYISTISSFVLPTMSSQQLIDSLNHKLKLLANADESAIKRAEDEYIKKNTLLKKEVIALKEKLISLELLAGRKLKFSSLSWFSVDVQFFLPTPAETAAQITVAPFSETPEPGHFAFL